MSRTRPLSLSLSHTHTHTHEVNLVERRELELYNSRGRQPGRSQRIEVRRAPVSNTHRGAESVLLRGQQRLRSNQGVTTLLRQKFDRFGIVRGS